MYFIPLLEGVVIEEHMGSERIFLLWEAYSSCNKEMQYDWLCVWQAQFHWLSSNLVTYE